MMKNAFYFMFKAPFTLEIFVPTFLVMQTRPISQEVKAARQLNLVS